MERGEGKLRFGGRRGGVLHIGKWELLVHWCVAENGKSHLQRRTVLESVSNIYIFKRIVKQFLDEFEIWIYFYIIDLYNRYLPVIHCKN